MHVILICCLVNPPMLASGMGWAGRYKRHETQMQLEEEGSEVNGDVNLISHMETSTRPNTSNIYFEGKEKNEPSV